MIAKKNVISRVNLDVGRDQMIGGRSELTFLASIFVQQHLE